MKRDSISYCMLFVRILLRYHPKQFRDLVKSLSNANNTTFFKMEIFTKMENVIVRFKWNCKETWIYKIILKKKERVRRLTFPNIKAHSEAIVMKKTVILALGRYIETWINEESRNKPIELSLSIHQGTKIIQWRKNSLFNKQCWQN